MRSAYFIGMGATLACYSIYAAMQGKMEDGTLIALGIHSL